MKNLIIVLFTFFCQNIFSQFGESPCQPINAGHVSLLEYSDIGNFSFNTKSVTAEMPDLITQVEYPLENSICTNLPFSIWGDWIGFTVGSGVEILNITHTGGGLVDNTEVFVSFFQGSDCSSLTQISCSPFVSFFNNEFVIYPVFLEGFNPLQPVWMYVNAEGGYHNLGVSIVGSKKSEREDCSNISYFSNGSNIGAPGDSHLNNFLPTTVLGEMACSGGDWYSNENTVYYEVSSNSENGSISIKDVVCNDGVSGEAQFGLWKVCSSIGDMSSYSNYEFVSCAVGSGELELSGMNLGQKYILMIDGYAGDICKWDFVLRGISLTGGESDVLSSFTYSVIEEVPYSVTVDFLNTSENSLEWEWDFGDGEISNEKNPTHSYTESGEYKVRLISYDSGTHIGIMTEQFINVVVPSSLSIGEFNENTLINISDGVLKLSSKGMLKSVEVYSIDGRLVYAKKGIGENSYESQVDVGEGVFIVVVNNFDGHKVISL